VPLEATLKQARHQKLESYVKPVIDDQMKRFVKTHTLEYNGNEYELADRFNNEHNEISNLIHSLETTQKALAENYIYEIYFKNGITHRDDNVLRFINYINNGVTDIGIVKEHYKNILTENEIIKTVQKLQSEGCIDIIGNEILITNIGKHIV
jgi:hypothetical protein